MLNQKTQMKKSLEADHCPKCGTPLIFNLGYGTDDCPKCGYYKGNSD